jgi:hypothetical protein
MPLQSNVSNRRSRQSLSTVVSKALALIDLPFAVGAVASEGMDSSSSGYHFATVG